MTATAIASVIAADVIIQIRGWLGKKVENIWEDEVWDAARAEEEKSNQSNTTCRNQLLG
jgi:hypothetical protein